MTSVLAVSAASPSDVVAMSEIMWDEFREWAGPGKALVSGAGVQVPLVPSEQGGLPPGWEVWGSAPHPVWDDTEFVLARRQGGGWVLMRYEADLSALALYWLDLSLGELHAHIAEAVAERGAGAVRDPALPYLEGWLRSLIVDCFDEGDPVEAAEKVVFALGGALNRVPAVLR